MELSGKPPVILGLFAKHPDYVAVKTRLARTMGTDKAHQIARMMTGFLLGHLADAGLEREIVCWPPESADSFQAEAGALWNVVPQSGGDLGNRLSSWFHSALDGGNRLAIAIGSDCPFVQPHHIDQAVALLRGGNDMVLGPAEDGGYWLVGLNRKPCAIFSNVDWGTGQVLEATMQNAKTAGWKLASLETLRDVDEIEDLTVAVDQLFRNADPESVKLAQQLSRLMQVEKP